MLIVSIVPAPPTGPSVKIHQPDFDKDKRGGPACVSSRTKRVRSNPAASRQIRSPANITSETATWVRHSSPRPAVPTRGITLRTGPADNAIGDGAPGAAVSLQIFSVTGEPSINKNGTVRKEDDFITGETTPACG